ncbi:hypothetical protein DL764_002326 [Monosporascus ibericus]|uniref:Pyrroline-5-carboxylate reductase dimerisation domain-containing protein n=1 Tax=Monosporascus ibericus TaxID=155417 RepID=A0A4Q4TNF2_9PEZI|nr:hypothetical protein DL764_002326 [Monosporascus ibericus]
MAAESPPQKGPIVKALEEFTTCDVSDALCKLGQPHGGFLPGLTMWSPQRQDGPAKIVGPAYTVKYVPLDYPAPKHPTHYIDSVPKDAVVFVSCPPGTPNAVYGGLMSMRAQVRGAVGSVIDGRFRDLQEQRELGYPIFARGVGTAPPAPLLKVAGVDVPLRVQSRQDDEDSTVVRPGDYVVADLNGVVVLPAELAERALPLMRKQVDADDCMAVEIKKGMGFSEASRLFRGLKDNFQVVSRRNVQVAVQSEAITLACPPGVIRTDLSESGTREALHQKIGISIAARGHATSDRENLIRGSRHRRERQRQNLGRPSIAEHCCVARGPRLVSRSLTRRLPEDKSKVVDSIFNRIGKLSRIPASTMDACLVMCGSAPTFTALFSPVMVDGAVASGLNRKHAESMVSRSLSSTVAVLESGRRLAEIRKYVCANPGCAIGDDPSFELVWCEGFHSRGYS